MAKHDKRGRTKSHFAGTFVGVETGIMSSPAWRHLEGEAVKLLLDVMSRVKYDGSNNGEVSFSTREAAALLRCTKNTAAKRFRQLVDHGFLAETRKGAFSVKLSHASLWRITLLPSFEGGKPVPATRDYQRWRSPPETLRMNAPSEAKKKNTVSLRDADGISQEYRDAKKAAPKSLTVSRMNTVNDQNQPSTVSLSDTHLESAIGRNEPISIPEAMSAIATAIRAEIDQRVLP